MATTMNSRTLAQSDRSFYLSPQSVQGAIDANPVFTPYHLRTGGTGTVTQNYVESSAIKTDRQPSGAFRIGEDYAASIEAEFSSEMMPMVYAAIHSEKTVVSTTSTTIEATATGFTGGGTDFTNLATGDIVFMSGFANADLNTSYLITNKVGDVLTTSPAPAATEAPGASVTAASNFADAASVYNLWTGQTRTHDESLADDTNFETLYNGFSNTFAMATPEEGIITTTLGLMFERRLNSTAKVTGQTDNPQSDEGATTTPLKTVWIDGVKSENCDVVSMDWEFSNNYESSKAAQCPGAKMAIGTIALTGSLVTRAYVSDTSVWQNKNRNDQVTSLIIEYEFKTGERVAFAFHAIKINEHSFDGDTVVNNSMSFTAQRDANAGTCLTVYTNF